MPDPDEPEAVPEDEQRRRRSAVLFLFVVLTVLFVVGIPAAVLGPLSSGGTGELTVTVVDQNGEPASGQEVQVLDPTTGEVIASGTTDENGEVEFTLDQGEYEIVAGDSEKDITLDDQTDAELTVDTSPPEPDERARHWGRS